MLRGQCIANCFLWRQLLKLIAACISPAIQMLVCRPAAKLLHGSEHAVAVVLQLRMPCKDYSCIACAAAAVTLLLYSKTSTRAAASAVQLLSSLQDIEVWPLPLCGQHVLLICRLKLNPGPYGTLQS